MFASDRCRMGKGTGPADWWPWGVLIAVVVIFILGGSVRSVTPLYFEAAEHWLGTEDLYIRGGRGFLYLPQAAMLAVPFNFLPKTFGEVCWRLMTIGVFAAGVHRLCRLVFREGGFDASLIDGAPRLVTGEHKASGRLFVATSCVAVPLAWSSALNGQSTLMIAGLMMLAAYDIVRNHFWRAAWLLALALAFKPLAIVMILLVGCLWRPMASRLIVTCAAALASPYLLQSPEYVTRQYAGCLAMLGDAARLGARTSWAQIFGMLKLLGIEITEPYQALGRLAAAGAVLAAGWHVRRRLDPPRAMAYLYTFAMCYLMLFNPRTENNSYAMLGPPIGWCCAEAFLVERRMRRGWFFLVIGLGTVGSHAVGRLFLPAERPIWLAPLMALCFTAELTVQLFRETSGRRPLDASRPLITLTRVSPAKAKPGKSRPTRKVSRKLKTGRVDSR